MPMHVTVKKQHRGPTLRLTFFIVGEKHDCSSVENTVDDLALVSFNFFVNYDNTLNTNVRVKRKEAVKSSVIKIRISSETTEKELLCSDDWSKFEDFVFRQASDCIIDNILKICGYSLEVTVTAQDISHQTSLSNKALYEDSQFTDFKLSTPDGTVGVHKAILATHSEVFRALIRDGSNETDGRFTIRGVNVQTLRHLKEYMYLGALPLSGLPELLLVAVHSKMNKLKDDCIMKLASVVTAADLDALIDFAIQNNIPELLRAMLSVTPASAIHDAHQTRKSRLQFCDLDFKQLALE